MLLSFFIVRRYMNNLVQRGVSGSWQKWHFSRYALSVIAQHSKGLLFKKVLPKQVASACVVVVGRDMLTNCAKICLYEDLLIIHWWSPLLKPKLRCIMNCFLCVGSTFHKWNMLSWNSMSHVPIPQETWAEDYGFCVHCPITVKRCWEVAILQDSKF